MSNTITFVVTELNTPSANALEKLHTSVYGIIKEQSENNPNKKSA